MQTKYITNTVEPGVSKLFGKRKKFTNCPFWKEAKPGISKHKVY